jgi:hypothetical protein
MTKAGTLSRATTTELATLLSALNDYNEAQNGQGLLVAKVVLALDDPAEPWDAVWLEYDGDYDALVAKVTKAA